MSDAPATESVIARLKPHRRALVFPTVLLLAVVFCLFYFGGRFLLRAAEWQQLAALIAAATLIVAGWLIPLLGWASTSYTITTRRVVLRSGLLTRSRQELLHSRGYDVTVRRTVGQRLMGSGDVVMGAGPDHTVTMRDVASAGLVQEVLHDLVEAARNRPAAFG